MTDYLAIQETETNPNATPRSSLFKRLANNWIAAFEGAAGAPRLRLPALQELTAGTVIRSRIDAIGSVAGGTALVHAFGFGQSGRVRVVADHRISAATGAISVLVFRRWRGGVFTDVATFSNATTAYITRSADIDVLPGDTLDVRHSASAQTSFVQNCRFQTGGEYMFPFGQFVPLE